MRQRVIDEVERGRRGREAIVTDLFAANRPTGCPPNHPLNAPIGASGFTGGNLLGPRYIGVVDAFSAFGLFAFTATR